MYSCDHHLNYSFYIMVLAALPRSLGDSPAILFLKTVMFYHLKKTLHRSNWQKKDILGNRSRPKYFVIGFIFFIHYADTSYLFSIVFLPLYTFLKKFRDRKFNFNKFIFASDYVLKIIIPKSISDRVYQLCYFSFIFNSL